MEEIRKQGLSKGCLIGLIVAGALLLLIIVIGMTCYFKRDDLMKFGAAQLMNSVKTEIANQHLAGVDSARFNGTADAFIARLNNSELQYPEYKKFMIALQKITADKKIDSTEVHQLIDAMVAYYPDLDSLRPTTPQDTTPRAAESIAPAEPVSNK